MNVLAWVWENKEVILAVVSGLLTVASLVTGLTPTPKDDNVIRKMVAFLSFLQPRTSRGTVKLPGTTHAPEVASTPFSAVVEANKPAPRPGPTRTDRR